MGEPHSDHSIRFGNTVHTQQGVRNQGAFKGPRWREGRAFPYLLRCVRELGDDNVFRRGVHRDNLHALCVNEMFLVSILRWSEMEFCFPMQGAGDVE